jgi:hypothetical protein
MVAEDVERELGRSLSDVPLAAAARMLDLPNASELEVLC